MSKIKLISILLSALLISCKDGTIEFSKEYTFEQASESIIEYMLNKDSSMIIYGMPTILERGIHLLNPIPTVVETLIVEDDSWLFIVDHNYPYLSSIFGWYLLFNIYDGQIYGQSQHLMPSDLSIYKIVYAEEKN